MISAKNKIFKNSYLMHDTLILFFFSYPKIHNMTHKQKFIILRNVSIFSSCKHHVAKNIKRFQSNFSCYDFSIGAINANKQLQHTTEQNTKQDFQNLSHSWKMVFIWFSSFVRFIVEKRMSEGRNCSSCIRFHA